MRDYREALERLAERAQQEGCCAEAQIPMASLTTFRIGGPCGILFTASNPETAALLLRCCAEEEVPLLILGNGSNLLVSDKGIPGAVLRLSSGEIRFEKDRVICPAGVPLKALCRAVRDRGLAGLEFAYGIPGTVGGAVFMNAGAYGGEMKDVLLRAAACDSAGNRREYRAEEMELRYRHSRFMKEQLLVLEAELQLMPDDPSAITARMEEFLRRRREKQPLEYPSAGSFFKRPAGHYAGTLIESCGLKGYAVGGAQVSEKHAGFVINRGGATCAEVKQLAQDVMRRVWESTGVLLEPEVRFVGEKPPVI